MKILQWPFSSFTEITLTSHINSNCTKTFLTPQNNLQSLSCSLTLLKYIDWYEKIIKKICIFSFLFLNEIPIFLSIIDGLRSIKIISSNQKSMINKYFFFFKCHEIIIANIQNFQSKKYKVMFDNSFCFLFSKTCF